MLQVQKYLQKQTLKNLEEQHAIKVLHSKSDDRIILNYNQINSNKDSQIVKECRALTLSSIDYSLISRSFFRFFNLGETVRGVPQFNWHKPFNAEEKIDGSIINLFWYQGDWKIQTRHSFADTKPTSCPYTWCDLVRKGLDNTRFWDFEKDLRKMSFTFELCSPWNRVVQFHPQTKLVLLGLFKRQVELPLEIRNSIGKNLHMELPQSFIFNTIEECQDHIHKESERDMGYEGLVVQDCNGTRLKVKSNLYRELSKFWDNGNLLNNKNLVPLVMSGEIKKFSNYFNSAEIFSRIEEIKDKIREEYRQVDNLWHVYSSEKSKKKFAKFIEHCPYKHVLFKAYDCGGHPKDYWTPEFVLKKVFSDDSY